MKKTTYLLLILLVSTKSALSTYTIQIKIDKTYQCYFEYSSESRDDLVELLVKNPRYKYYRVFLDGRPHPCLYKNYPRGAHGKALIGTELWCVND